MSVSGVKALEEIISKIERANLLAKVMSVIPFFDIFLKGKPHEKLTNVATYDWEGFSEVMISINKIERKMIRDIAGRIMLETQGQRT